MALDQHDLRLVAVETAKQLGLETLEVSEVGPQPIQEGGGESLCVWRLDMRDTKNNRAFAVVLFDADYGEPADAKKDIREQVRRLAKVCPACGQYAAWERGTGPDGHEIIPVNCETCGRFNVNWQVAERLWAENVKQYEALKPRLHYWLSRTKGMRGDDVPHVTYDWPQRLTSEWDRR